MVFDNASCERRGIRMLEFDGRQDSIFRPFDRQGGHHMDYVEFIGECADLPYAEFAAEMRRACPGCWNSWSRSAWRAGDRAP
ncbi:hypothetical protein CSC94_08630 [Zhengella mangrovi]|uniref:Uncharacterized protein n=1 Tax=Zhengella mangrovi TaxID=1982044 RepID=A0A2G1QQE3_9HYPH|nr:hypothetical protein CSC94_08630 [Zhengella mangrovi]